MTRVEVKCTPAIRRRAGHRTCVTKLIEQLEEYETSSELPITTYIEELKRQQKKILEIGEDMINLLDEFRGYNCLDDLIDFDIS